MLDNLENVYLIEIKRNNNLTETPFSRFPVAYAQIDWHDFVVVETVDFQPNEHGR